MSTMKDLKSDFYIGWQEKAPQLFTQRSKRFIWAVLATVVLTAGLIVGFQKPFVGSTFEFGTISTLEGQLTLYPAPMLKIRENGQTQGVLLVGFGKIGAEKTLREMEEAQGVKLEGKSVTLRGTKIYHDGKMVLELSEGKAAFVEAKEMQPRPEIQRKDFGWVTLKGEILDPKCALGVMMPGEGKPHRSCAIRCISGGIPPLLRITNLEGQSNYILLRGMEKEAVNQQVLPYVADQIVICGQLVHEDDWLVLQTDPSSKITRISPYGAPEGITQCNQ